jgi:hypothetical protein
MTQQRDATSGGSIPRVRKFLLGGALLASPFAISSLQFGDDATPIPDGVDRVAMSPVTVSANTSAPVVLPDFRTGRDASLMSEALIQKRGVSHPDRRESRRASQTGDAHTGSVYEQDSRGLRGVSPSRNAAHRFDAVSITRSVATRVASRDEKYDAATSSQSILEYTTAAMGPVESVVLNADGTAQLTILGQTFSAPRNDVSVQTGEYAVAAG